MGEISEARLAGYVATYATKGTRSHRGHRPRDPRRGRARYRGARAAAECVRAARNTVVKAVVPSWRQSRPLSVLSLAPDRTKAPCAGWSGGLLCWWAILGLNQ